MHRGSFYSYGSMEALCPSLARVLRGLISRVDDLTTSFASLSQKLCKIIPLAAC